MLKSSLQSLSKGARYSNWVKTVHKRKFCLNLETKDSKKSKKSEIQKVENQDDFDLSTYKGYIYDINGLKAVNDPSNIAKFEK